MLEMEVLKEILPDREHRSMQLDISALSCVNVDQFYGIEIEEFPARIAEAGYWTMDHIMNNRLSIEYGRLRAYPFTHRSAYPFRRLPEMDWRTVLDPANCSYVLGNPPFIGSKLQTPTQRAQVQRIARLGGSGRHTGLRRGVVPKRANTCKAVRPRSGSLRPIRLRKVSKSRNFGRCSTCASTLKSAMPTRPSAGDQMREEHTRPRSNHWLGTSRPGTSTEAAFQLSVLNPLKSFISHQYPLLPFGSKPIAKLPLIVVQEECRSTNESHLKL